MGKEIKYNAAALAENIASLRALRSQLNAIDVTAQACDQGSGANFNSITKINESYADIKEALGELLDASVSFFTKVKADIVTAANDAKEAVQAVEKVNVVGKTGGEGK